MAGVIDTIGLQGNLIAAVIAKPERAGLIFASVPVEQFDVPHRYVAEAIHRLRLRRVEITLGTIEDQMLRSRLLDRYGGSANLVALTMACPTDEATVAYSLEQVARQVQLRDLRARAARMVQSIDEDPDLDPLEIARVMGETHDFVTARIEAISGDIYVPTLREFLAGDDVSEYDWCVPGLLEHGDRMILTGSEGLGKSTVLRQVAVCAAAGVHPFDHYEIPQKRVLVVDCENNPIPTRRALRPMRLAAAGLYGRDPGDWMHIESRPGGMRLDRPEDEAALLQMVEALNPDLLTIGPLYRLFTRDGNEEDTGRAVSRVLDRCRAISDCAIVTEAHTPHQSPGQARTLRPVGTSLWLRWPEFGYGITPTKEHTPESRSVKMLPWRGDRSERNWPKRLVGGGRLPWRHDVGDGASRDDEDVHAPVAFKD